MMKAKFYSKSSGGFYSVENHGSAMPDDVVEVPAEVYAALMNKPSGKVIVADELGFPVLADPSPVAISAENLCSQIDTAADTARRAVAGDPLRAVEYDRARIAAEQYAAAGYQGDVPAMVAAWAINGRTPQQAADSILQEAAQYTTALVQLRTVRLNAKELIRNAMAAGEVEQAEDIAGETIASIEAAVAGIGNNG